MAPHSGTSEMGGVRCSRQQASDAAWAGLCPPSRRSGMVDSP